MFWSEKSTNSHMYGATAEIRRQGAWCSFYGLNVLSKSGTTKSLNHGNTHRSIRTKATEVQNNYPSQGYLTEGGMKLHSVPGSKVRGAGITNGHKQHRAWKGHCKTRFDFCPKWSGCHPSFPICCFSHSPPPLLLHQLWGSQPSQASPQAKMKLSTEVLSFYQASELN